jgi:predicted transcriptional regulator
VNQAQQHVTMTVKAPDDVRQKLAEWAQKNLTSMSAEVVRSIRERAQREQAEAVQR